MDKVLVTFIQNNTLVASNRYTLREMLLTSAGYGTNNKQHYSKNFFEVRTFKTTPGPGPEPHNLIHLMTKLTLMEYTKEYISFRIPKANGGTRLIKAPTDNLKDLQKEIADIILYKLRVLPHNAAYAYTRGRCAYDALVTHQRANARWFLKIDIKDFFPSITTEVLLETLPKIYPLNYLTTEQLERLVDIATDEGSLPQGSPLSPLLSNLVMVEFDKELTQTLSHFNKQTYKYTRYADDMLITNPYDFRFDPIINLIKELFIKYNLPFNLAPQKIRYASMAGRNWNLGLMYTNEQRITVGTKKKKMLHSLVNSFVCEYPWDIQPTMELQGQLAYLKNIEPDYYESLISKYNTKYNVDVLGMIHTILTTK